MHNTLALLQNQNILISKRQDIGLWMTVKWKKFANFGILFIKNSTF